MNNQYGLGPYFVVLILNNTTNHKGSKKKSDIILHTYAHRVASIRNAMVEHDNWMTKQLIGPFSKLSNARVFYNLWSNKIRNKDAKIQRGFNLLNKYHGKYNLTMWFRESDDLSNIIKEPNRNETEESTDISIQDIEDMQIRRKE